MCPAWSMAYMRSMLSKAHITLPGSFLRGLSEAQWNELGDWLWYETTHPPSRPARFASPPAFLDGHLPSHYLITDKKVKKGTRK